MKLEVGMYIRFEDGELGKIIKYEYDDEIENGHIIKLDNVDYGIFSQDDDFKASHNLIDLIEAGDLILKTTGEKVEVNDVSLGRGNFILCGLKRVYPEDIKSIVTKELYKSVEYEV